LIEECDAASLHLWHLESSVTVMETPGTDRGRLKRRAEEARRTSAEAIAELQTHRLLHGCLARHLRGTKYPGSLATGRLRFALKRSRRQRVPRYTLHDQQKAHRGRGRGLDPLIQAPGDA